MSNLPEHGMAPAVLDYLQHIHGDPYLIEYFSGFEPSLSLVSCCYPLSVSAHGLTLSNGLLKHVRPDPAKRFDCCRCTPKFHFWLSLSSCNRDRVNHCVEFELRPLAFGFDTMIARIQPSIQLKFLLTSTTLPGLPVGRPPP